MTEGVVLHTQKVAVGDPPTPMPKLLVPPHRGATTIP